MFTIELLPAAHGDAVWIEYGDPKKPWRIVIDGGPASSYQQGLRQRIEHVPEADRRIDLFVVTHIDCDHIDASLILLQEAKALKVRFGDIWFNAWEQLETVAPETYQPIHGEFLGALLDAGGMRRRWNAVVNGGPLVVPEEGPLPSWPLEDGARVTLLSPGLRQLKRLRARWQSAIRDLGPRDTADLLARLRNRREYRPPAFPPVFAVRSAGDDRSVANGSSLAFALEYKDASCLLTADAHPRVIASSLSRLARVRNPGRGGAVRFDIVKLPHHGSIGNISDDLVAAIDARRWLVSTNGDSSARHPHAATAALVAKHAAEPPEFLCNYKSASTLAFAADAGDRWHTRYPGEGVDRGPTGGIRIDLTTNGRERTPRARRARRR